MKMISLLVLRKKLKFLMNSLQNNVQLFQVVAKLPSVFISKTDKYLSTVTFYENEIKKAICDLDPNKAHGYDMLSICMIKICDDSLC